MSTILKGGPDDGTIYSTDPGGDVVIGNFEQPNKDDGVGYARYIDAHTKDSDGNNIFMFKEMC